MKKLFPKVLIIGFVWPEPASSAAGSRMMQLIEFFKELGSDIIFVSTAKKSEYSSDFETMEIRSESIRVNDSAFDGFVKELNPDLVLFDRFMTEEQFGWRVHDQCPGAVRVLDTEDLHCLRHSRLMSIKSGDSDYRMFLSSDIAKREIAAIFRCDLSLIISEYELNLLKVHFKVPAEILHYLPYMLDPVAYEVVDQWPDFENRNGFMTIGNFRHKPNLDAVNYLRKEIWPLIRKSLPDAHMHVYGAYPKQQVEEWHQPEKGFLIHGRADDANEVMKESKVCLAPLRFGAGLKGKLIEAMLNGTPSVTTTLGAEGIQGEHVWPGFIVDSPSEFAEASVKLYRDKPIWKRAQVSGREIINNRFSKKKLQAEFQKQLLKLHDELEIHRTHNFTGAMLHHHTMASTRFMSKWIEEKNRRL